MSVNHKNLSSPHHQVLTDRDVLGRRDMDEYSSDFPTHICAH